ncbi:MAG: hypothetical protein JSV88_31025 [Candidatus Aminicenantes bacterium]|nr:MAG: hypothetical protein JSV88_31025 [Candidatus Aminicenantes bacterium]
MNNKNLSYSYLDQLSPAEVFQLLSKAAGKYRGQYLDRVRIVFTGGMPFKFVDLEVPAPYGNKNWESQAEKETFEILVEAFKEMTGRRERNTYPGGVTRGILEGIAWLLLRSANETDEKIAGSKGDQYLVVTRAVDEKEAELLFRNLCFHATSTRVTSFDIDPAQGAGSRYLYHLKDDPRRKSSFSSLAASGLFEDHPCQVLKGFETEEHVTFLPQEAQPGERKLHYFCRLVEAAPVLFGSKEDRKSTGLTAAVLQWPRPPETLEKPGPETGDEMELEFLYLGELRFFRQELFTKRKVDRARFEYMHLKESQKALDGLAAAIHKAKPYVGYHLELQTTKFLEKNPLERLLDQKARIEHNIAYLQGITVPQPVLMRFNQEQLPALAAQVRSFPMHIIHDGRLKYGFQAFDNEPTGYHFILIDLRETGRSGLDPLPLWQELDVDIPHMRFRLDPFWAYHYYEAGGDSMVFVPGGCALFPPIHDWERGNMDQFLRETIGHWFQDRLRGQTIPARPIYIFEGAPGSKSPIHVSVLDQDRMEPLHLRLSWINDNLIINRALEKESLMKEMAKDITWGELAQRIKIETEKTRKDFSETALTTSKYMAKTTNEMTQVLTAEIDRVVKETFRMTQKIRRLHQRLQEWNKVLEDMEKILQEVRQKKQDISYQTGAAKNEFWRMEQQIQREIQASGKRRNELEEKIAEEVQKLQTTTQRLKQRLKSVKL